MAITRGNTQTATANGDPGAVTKPTGLADGDVLITVMGTSAASGTPPSGFTTIGSATTSASERVTVAYKVVSSAAGEPSSYSWSGASGRTSIAITAYSGVDNTTPIDVSASTATGSGSVNLSTTTATDNAMIFAASVADYASASMTIPSGMTSVFNLGTPGRRTAAAELAQATAGATGTKTFTGSGSLAQAGIIFALREDGAGGGGGETVTNLWVGGVTSSSATVAAKVSGGTDATLVVSTSSDLSSPSSGSSVAISSGRVIVSISGLSAATQYYYGIDIDGTLDEVTTGSFRTAPSGAASFEFAFGSCNTTGDDSDAFTRALARDPDLCIINGDLHYEDPASESDFHTGFDTQLESTSMGDMLANVPTAYTWSDHDWSSDTNGGASSAMNSTANAVYRARVPSYTLEESTTGIHHTFVWGRCRFIITDERSFKSDNDDTDDSSKTMLGTDQKTWFKDLITNSTEPVIFWVGDTPWNGTASSPDDEWFAYDTERQELATHISGSGKNVIRLSGDMHAVAADDGTNSPGGIPILQASPWFNSYSNKAGPYTSGPYPTSGSGSIEQYGYVTVTDAGGDITVSFVGYDSSDTSRATWSDTYDTSTPNEGSASGTLGLAGSASGTMDPAGSSSGTLSLAGSASGTMDPSGSASGTVSLSGSAMGAREPEGSSSGTISLAGSTTGAADYQGEATGGIDWTGSAAGSAPATSNGGAASGTASWAGTATGAAALEGSASGSSAWSAASTGASDYQGSTSGTTARAGSSSGARTSSGSSAGTVSRSGSVSGEAPAFELQEGSATGTVGWSCASTGARASKGTIAGIHRWIGTAAGPGPRNFEPPTHEEPMRTRVHPLVYYRLTYASSVVKVDGTFVSMRTPTPEQLEGLTEGVDFFRGGYQYEVSSAIASELEADGYSVD